MFIENSLFQFVIFSEFDLTMEERLKQYAETVKRIEGVYPTKERMDRLRADMEKCEGTSVCTPTPASEQPTVETNTSVDSGTTMSTEAELFKVNLQLILEQRERIDHLTKVTEESIKKIEQLQKTCSYLLSRDRDDSPLFFEYQNAH